MEKDCASENIVNGLNIGMLALWKFRKHIPIYGFWMTRRKQDMETVNRAFVKPKDDPKLISPTIGGVPPST